MVYIQNRTDGWQFRFANMHLCIGPNPAYPTASGNTCTEDPIHDGGFVVVIDLPEGRYFFLDRRDGIPYGALSEIYLNFSVLEAFQSTNLLEYGVEI